MELRHLRYFQAVAEELSFRGAAERLFISQPTLSAQIRQLEEEISVKLLLRDTHRVSLTPAGAYFLEQAREVLRSVEEMTRQAQRIARGESGELSIGFVPSLGHGLLPGLLRAYKKRFPNVGLRLIQMDTTQQIDAIHNRKLDLGFIGLGLSKEVSGLRMATVAEEGLMAVFPQGHPLTWIPADKESKEGTIKTKSSPEERKEGNFKQENDFVKVRSEIALSELSQEPFLFASRKGAPLFNPWLIVLCQQAGFQPEVIREEGQPITVLNYVAAGLGISILPAQFSRLSTVGVTFVPLAPPVPSYRYCAAWSPHHEHPGIQHFVSLISELA